MNRPTKVLALAAGISAAGLVPASAAAAEGAPHASASPVVVEYVVDGGDAPVAVAEAGVPAQESFHLAEDPFIRKMAIAASVATLLGGAGLASERAIARRRDTADQR